MSLRILVVDDEQDGARAVAKLLGMSGHEVHTAGTYVEALALARERRIDLLIADIGLPDRDGLDLIRELRSLYYVPGIVVSGYCVEELIEQARAAGFSKFLPKPVIFEHLLAAIDELKGTGKIP